MATVALSLQPASPAILQPAPPAIWVSLMTAFFVGLCFGALLAGAVVFVSIASVA